MLAPRPLLAVALALMLTGPALAETELMSVETSAGKILTDAKGMTLYTFDNDKDGMSSCYDSCASNWPPAIAPSGAKASGDYGLTERKDGQMQWTYYGMPLYLWAQDMKPGDMTGDGMKGVWHTTVMKD